MSPEARSMEVPPGLGGKRLDQVLDQLVETHTRSQLQKLVRKGRVRVDGKRVVRSNIGVSAGARIQIHFDGPPAHEPASRPPLEPLTVVFADEHLVVVDKPAGWLPHPAPRSESPSVADELQRLYGPLPTPFGEERGGIVHRLDRETSGLMVAGRTAEVMHALKDQFRARTVEKLYVALVGGRPERDEFQVEGPLGPVPGKHDRQQLNPPGAGKDSETEFEVVERYRRHALIHCYPKTGRRHQIRVHLAARGLPVVGDALYGTRTAAPLPRGCVEPRRHALHAGGLRFEHPHSGERVSFRAPLPSDLEALRRALSADGGRRSS